MSERTSGKRTTQCGGVRSALIIVIAIAALLGGGVFLLLNGGQPLKNGQTLADGRIEIVVDGFIAAYIVDLDDGGLALVDAGMDPAAEAVKTALNNRNRGASDVEAVLFTHGHGDHIAGARAFPDAELYALAADADLVEGRRVAQSPFARNRTPELTGLIVDRKLNDGDIIELGGTPVEVFAIPGHTLGSASYLIHDVLFLGDSAAAARNGTIAAAPPVFSADREQNRQSLKRLAQKLEGRRDDVAALAFGHQGPLEGLDPLMKWAARSP